MVDSSKDDTRRETRENVIDQNSPEILTNSIYTPAFLRTQIGKLMRVEFLIGTNNLVDRVDEDGVSYKGLPTYNCEVTINENTKRVSKVEFTINK